MSSPVQILFLFESFLFQFFHVALLRVGVPHRVRDHLQRLVGLRLLLGQLFLLLGLRDQVGEFDIFEMIVFFKNDAADCSTNQKLFEHLEHRGSISC